MNNYNLDDNQEGFEFIIGGHKFFMRYPNTVEINEMNKISADKSLSPEEQAKKQGELVYNFINPVDHEENLESILDTVGVNKLKAFNHMLKTEMSIE